MNEVYSPQTYSCLSHLLGQIRELPLSGICMGLRKQE